MRKTEKAPNDGITLGIYFGNSNSGAAALDEAGIPQPIKNAEGNFMTPSVICFTEDNQIVVGPEAKNIAVAYPQSMILGIKRHMGKTSSDGKPIPICIDKNGRVWLPEELAAPILKKIKKDAEAFLGRPISPVVVTAPAYYVEAERRAILNAAKAAGLDAIGLMDEPVAAAICYGVTRKTGKYCLYLICDLGGGTFDVSLIRVENGEVTVIATDGECNLGGTDWSQRIHKRIEQELKKKGIILDPVNDTAACQDILDKAERFKHSLSVEGRTEAMFISKVQSKLIRFKYSREEFESNTHDLLERMGVKVTAVLDASGTTPSALNGTLLVGGATRMPMVKKYLTQLLGKPPKRDAAPDLVMARGAALAAAKMAKGDSRAVRSLNGQVVHLGFSTVKSKKSQEIEQTYITQMMYDTTELNSASFEVQSQAAETIKQLNDVRQVCQAGCPAPRCSSPASQTGQQFCQPVRQYPFPAPGQQTYRPALSAYSPGKGFMSDYRVVQTYRACRRVLRLPYQWIQSIPEGVRRQTAAATCAIAVLLAISRLTSCPSVSFVSSVIPAQRTVPTPTIRSSPWFNKSRCDLLVRTWPASKVTIGRDTMIDAPARLPVSISPGTQTIRFIPTDSTLSPIEINIDLPKNQSMELQVNLISKEWNLVNKGNLTEKVQ